MFRRCVFIIKSKTSHIAFSSLEMWNSRLFDDSLMSFPCFQDVILDILQSKTLIEAMMAKESFKTIEVTDANRPDNKERNIMPTSQNRYFFLKLEVICIFVPFCLNLGLYFV